MKMKQETTLQQEFTIQLDGGVFWQYVDGEDSQVPMSANMLDSLANGFKWSMAVQGSGQRKRHARSVMTASIGTMLDNVRAELKADCNARVYCVTPDVEVLFVC